MRWLLLDEVTEIRKGRFAKTKSRVPAGASPAVLLMEMMAQTGGLLLGAEDDFARDIVFAKIEEADFSPSLKTGDSLEIEASSGDLRSEGAWLEAAVHSKGGQVARSRFLLVGAGNLRPELGRSVTFHPAFMNHFRVREKVR